MRSTTLVLAAAASFAVLADGFSTNSVSTSTQRTASSSSTALDAASRRNVLTEFAVGLAAATATAVAIPQVANADVTNKVASTPALRKLKRAQQILPKLLPTVQSNDYVAVKAFFRTPPFDDVRKSAFIIVRGGEDGPRAGELEASYKQFIASVEKIDGTASLGMRGRSIQPLQMAQEYDTIVATMESFLKVRKISL